MFLSYLILYIKVSNSLERSRNTLKGISSLSIFDIILSINSKVAYAGQRDTTKNHGRLGGIRQTPGYLQKQHCHLPEETGVQLLFAASYDINIWCRDLDTDQTSTEQTCGRTDQNGKKYAQHHIQR